MIEYYSLERVDQLIISRPEHLHYILVPGRVFQLPFGDFLSRENEHVGRFSDDTVRGTFIVEISRRKRHGTGFFSLYVIQQNLAIFLLLVNEDCSFQDNR